MTSQSLSDTMEARCLFYVSSITPITKTAKDSTEKENYRPISLKNSDAKIFTILANKIQQYIKENPQHD